LARPYTGGRAQTSGPRAGRLVSEDGRRDCAGRGTPARRSGDRQGLNGQTNVLQLANVVLALSPMNSVADQMSPLGSANEAL